MDAVSAICRQRRRQLQPPVPAGTTKGRCAGAIFREQFVSVRGYGLRTYEPRQSRNAATVV